MPKLDAFAIRNPVQASQVPPVQAPVQQQVTQSALASGMNTLGNIVGVVGDVVSSNRREAADEAEAAAKKASIEASNDLLSVFQGAANSVGQEGGSSARAAEVVSKATNAAVAAGFLSREDIMDLKTKAFKLPSFKPLVEGTAAERASRELTDEFMASPYYNVNASKSEQLEGRNKWDEARSDNETHRIAMQGHALNIAKTNAGSAERKEEERKQDLTQQNRATSLIKSLPLVINNTITGLQDKRKAAIAEGMPVAQADTLYKQALEQAKNAQSAQVRNLQGQTNSGLPIHGRLALDTITANFDTAIKYAGSTEANLQLESQMANTNLTNANALLNTSESAQVIGASELIARGAGPLLLPDIVAFVPEARAVIKQNVERVDGGPPPDLSPKNNGTVNFYKGFQANLTNLDKTNPDGTPMVDIETISTQASGVLAYASDAQGKVSLGEFDRVVENMATVGFGNLIKKRGGLNQQDLSNAQLALGKYAEDVADSVQSVMRQAIDVEERTKGLGKYASAHAKVLRHTEPTKGALDIKLVNGQVVVKSSAPGSRRLADELTRKMNGPLTRAIRASANINGTTPEQEFNNWLPQLWPEKYGEQEEGAVGEGEGNSTGAVADEKETQSIPNGQYTDSRTGKPFTINNGNRTEGWE